MKIHNESKAFKCDVCLKRFSCKANLLTHYRIHTNEKPIACKIFNKKFAQKIHLIRNQATQS